MTAFRNTMFAVSAMFLAPALAWAGEVNITASLPHVEIDYQGSKVRIERIQDQENVLNNSFAKTSRKCPPFCIHEMTAAPGVTTVGEIELLEFLMTQVKNGTGVLVDARVPSFYEKGTIPGSVNIPFTVLTKDVGDPELDSALQRFGVTRSTMGQLDFTRAKRLMLWCNGPWCDQSPRAIKGLTGLGYPPSLLYYYRGGMQMWQNLGMTTVPGK